MSLPPDRVLSAPRRWVCLGTWMGVAVSSASAATDVAATDSIGLWIGLGLALFAGLVWWRRRAASPPSIRRRRTDRAPGSGFLSTQLDSVQDTVLDPRTLEPQRRIGSYLIERDIGRGAMGAVLLCRDERTGEVVALKTMALGREFHGEALTEARERFFREAEMAGRLQHPDIVVVREAGEQDGTAYIAMELLSGSDLSEFTQPTRLLPVPAVLGIVARVAKALAYAHRQGVTHRDIKPANIMVELKSGMVKVTDFGIARIIDSTQTRTGLVLGTPSFMSPEQMAGARVDGRSDLYALGVTLFQLLTGALPHSPDSMAELIRSIANDVAPDVRTLRPELPAALADIVALALEKRPEVRYADGEALAADLHAVLVQLRAPTNAAAGPAAEAAAPATAPAAPEAGHNP
ncbi:serine/threonine-protein kinase [Methylibium sp.]|uniref:serine/threonine-protein kinase n=1 Tax=Methylibium sp. TaxID=2067992 RepID=UPI003D0F78B4